MDSILRSRRTQTHHGEHLRLSDDYQISQEGSRFGETHVTGGSVFQGNFVGLSINSTVAARPDYAGQFAHSSLEPVKAYILRTSLTHQIRTQLWQHAAVTSPNSSTSISPSTLAVWGLGGAGKTQLVLDYMRRHRAKYRATFWIEAGRKESLERDFIDLYKTLSHLHTSAEVERINVEHAISGVKSWFSERQGPWLMVFDGADSINDKAASGYIDIRHFIPNAPSLHVIITSRSSVAVAMTQLDGVHVGEMEQEQAVNLFYYYSQLPRDDISIKDEVETAVKELGCLALAVTLAATYVGSTPRLQSNIKEYLPEYRQRRQQLLSQKPEELFHRYSESVLTTWETSYQAVAEQCPEASVLMTMLSFLNFDDIYMGLFKTKADKGWIDNVPSTLIVVLQNPWLFTISSVVAGLVFQDIYQLLFGSDGITNWEYLCLLVQLRDVRDIIYYSRLLVIDLLLRLLTNMLLRFLLHAFLEYNGIFSPLLGLEAEKDWKIVVSPKKPLDMYKIEECFRVLQKYSLVQWKTDRQSYTMHKMVHAWGQDRLTVKEQRNFVNIGLNLIVETVKGCGPKPEDKIRLVPHVMANFTALCDASKTSNIATRLISVRLDDIAGFLIKIGRALEAHAISKFVLDQRIRILGKDHPEAISAMNNLAITLTDQGRLEEAAKIDIDVLEKRKRILGHKHLHTISTMENLGMTLKDQGRLNDAEKLIEEVLKKRKQFLGEEHLDTIQSINNLASTIAGQGRLVEANTMFRIVFEKRTRILGDMHPETVSAMSNLAVTLEKQGQLEEAANMMKEVREKMTQILGDKHPTTISALSNLATMSREQCQLEEATRVLKEVLENRRQILGEEHPDTIKSMGNFAAMLRKHGQLEEAAKMTNEVVKKLMRILGNEHMDTISMMANLAIMLEEQGRLDEAEKWKKEVAKKKTKVLGEEHPETISAMNSLAFTLRTQGRLEEAAKMAREVVEKRSRSLGEEHLDTIFSTVNLAVMLEEQGLMEEAAILKNEAAKKVIRILGDESLDQR